MTRKDYTALAATTHLLLNLKMLTVDGFNLLVRELDQNANFKRSSFIKKAVPKNYGDAHLVRHD